MIRWHIFILASILLLVLPSCNNGIVEPDASDWRTVSPQAAGMDADLLYRLDARIQSGSYGTIHSVLVIRHGNLVMESYYNGATRSTLHQLFSDTKSVASCLVGIAHERGDIPGLDTKIFSYFPEYDSLAAGDSLKAGITIGNILTMSAGLKWDELSVSYFDPVNSFKQMESSENWVGYVLGLPMVTTPGVHFTYNSGSSVVLGEILHRATGSDVESYALVHLFRPLAISVWQWLDAPQHVANTASGLFLRPRDMAKFGQLYLQDGLWNGQQVVPADWVTASTTPQISATGIYSYGYQWWIMPTYIPLTGKTENIAIAWGWAGQFIFVVRSLDMVVVSTADNETGSNMDAAIGFVPSYIIRAATSL